MNPKQLIAAGYKPREVQRMIDSESRCYGEAFEELPVPRTLEPRQPIKVWRNRHLLAQLYDDRPDGTGDSFRLSINSARIDKHGDWIDGITWDTLQRVKTQVGFGDWWAYEIYPPDRQVVNIANIRHLVLSCSAPPGAWIDDEDAHV